MLGVLVLANLVDSDALTRTIAFLFVLVVWALQLAWSKPWLEHFRFGPFEWAWRVLTYRRLQPILRSESGVSRRQSGKEQTGAPRR